MIFLEESGSGVPPAPTLKCARGAGEPEARQTVCPPAPSALRPDWPASDSRGTPPTPPGGASDGDEPNLFWLSFGGRPVVRIDRRLACSWAVGLVWTLLILWAFYYLH